MSYVYTICIICPFKYVSRRLTRCTFYWMCRDLETIWGCRIAKVWFSKSFKIETFTPSILILLIFLSNNTISLMQFPSSSNPFLNLSVFWNSLLNSSLLQDLSGNHFSKFLQITGQSVILRWGTGKFGKVNPFAKHDGQGQSVGETGISSVINPDYNTSDVFINCIDLHFLEMEQ